MYVVETKGHKFNVINYVQNNSQLNNLRHATKNDACYLKNTLS